VGLDHEVGRAHGFKGVQLPSLDGQLIELKKAAASKTYCDEIAGSPAPTGSRSPSSHPSPGPAGGQPTQTISRSGSGAGAAAARVTRLPAGHPEG
jgi:hypothetical protein